MSADNNFFYLAAGGANLDLKPKFCEADGGCTTEDIESDAQSGATLGLGADFGLNENWRIDVSYDRTFGDLGDSDVYAASVRYQF